MPVICKDNQIHVIGRIDEILAIQFSEKLDSVLSQQDDTIELHICSRGGSLKEAHNMLDKIQLSYKPIHTFIHNGDIYGEYTGVASAASLITSYTNSKTIDFNATFLVHHNSSNSEDEYDISFWMGKTGLDYDVVTQLLKEETKMDAKSALLLGFIDEIRYDVYEMPL